MSRERFLVSSVILLIFILAFSQEFQEDPIVKVDKIVTDGCLRQGDHTAIVSEEGECYDLSGHDYVELGGCYQLRYDQGVYHKVKEVPCQGGIGARISQ